MSAIEIRFLGKLELQSVGQPLPLPATYKARSLLAYLITHRERPCFREPLAERFWPDRAPDRALHSLSTALWHIRRVLPPGELLLADAHSVQFNPDSDFWLDVEAFHTGLRPPSIPEPPAEEAARLQKTISLYRGDFLEHFYDDWCLEERYALEARYLQALDRLLVLRTTLNQPETALETARQLLARDPLREDIHCAVIRLLVELNRPSDALRQARACRDTLHTELGLLPGPETVTLCTELLGAGWDRDIEGLLSPPTSPPALRLPLLTRPPFVGRATEWTYLLARWDAALAGRGHLVLLNGEAGIGKTRLSEELYAHVQQHGGQTALARCYEHERILPYGPLADLLRTLIPSSGPELLKHLPAWQADELAYLLPESGRPTQPTTAPPDPQRQARLFDAINFFLLEQAQLHPLLLIVEDLHWASDSTLAWFHSLGRRLESAPLLLLGSCRCEHVTASHPLHRLYACLEQAGVASRVDLARLSPQAFSGWFAGALPDFARRLHQQTEGNPFFALETLRALHDAGLIGVTVAHRLEVTLPETLPIPESVREAIRLRLAQLSPLAREFAALAAIIGRTFDFETLHHASGDTEETTLEALDELLRRGLVRESQTPEQADYEFDHHLIQELLYTDLHYRRRRRWHRAVGEALERSAPQPDLAARIAYHLDAAGIVRRALPYYEGAAREAQRQFAWQDAERYFARVLGLLDSLDQETVTPEQRRRRATILAQRAEQLDNLGRLEERDADIAALELLAEDSADPQIQLLSLIQQTRALNYGGHYGEALQQAECGLSLARAEEDTDHTCRFLIYIASAHYFQGHPRRALMALEQAASLLDVTNRSHDLLRARLHQYLGYTYFHLAQWEQALCHHEQALHINLNLGNLIRAVWNRLDAAYLHLKMGQRQEARLGLQTGLETARQLHLPAAEGYALLLLGEWELYRGHYAAAEELLQRGRPFNEASRGEHNALATRELLGWVRYHLRDLAPAREFFESSVATARRIGHRRLLIASLVGLSLVLAEEGSPAPSQPLLEEAIALARESGCVENLLKGRCALARITRLRGSASHALDYAQEALRLSRQQTIPTLEMWAALEAGLAHLALGEAEAALRHTALAVALLPRAHAAWIRAEEVHAAHNWALANTPRPPTG